MRSSSFLLLLRLSSLIEAQISQLAVSLGWREEAGARKALTYEALFRSTRPSLFTNPAFPLKRAVIFAKKEPFLKCWSLFLSPRALVAAANCTFPHCIIAFMTSLPILPPRLMNLDSAKNAARSQGREREGGKECYSFLLFLGGVIGLPFHFLSCAQLS